MRNLQRQGPLKGGLARRLLRNSPSYPHLDVMQTNQGLSGCYLSMRVKNLVSITCLCSWNIETLLEKGPELEYVICRRKINKIAYRKQK